MRQFAIAVCVLAVACGPAQTSNSPADEPGGPGPRLEPASQDKTSPLAADAVAGVEHAGLQKALRKHWEWRMKRSPVWATTLGDHRYDDRLAPNSQDDVDAARMTTREFLASARALPESELSETDRITLALFIDDLEASVAAEVCDFHKWNVSAFGTPLGQFNSLPDRHKLTTALDGQSLLARYKNIAGSVDNTIANLRAGLDEGLSANAESVRRAIKMVDGQLGKPIDQWALLELVRKNKVLDKWSDKEADELLAALKAEIESSIKPAFVRYRALLDDVLAKARSGDKIGLGGLAIGKACYQARIRNYIALDMTAQQLHELGMSEIKRINAEMSALGKKLFKTSKLSRVIKRLRTDKKLYFGNKQDIVESARAALAAAKNKMPEYFGILPKADCVVVEIPDYEAPYTTIAYYRQPHFDGSKPGEYFINTYKPEVRPRFEMQVLAFHESIPGHHLQIAISQERTKLPAFRKFGGSTAFVEGWALYTERLSGEMGLYSSDLDRMGMLSYDAWRASRLVVDTGIHALGWTRARAEKFMLEHTALTPANIENEVDRYISWPGQALAYKVGQLEILRLRQQAKAALGAKFDIKSFHDAVLENGAVTLPVLEKQIAAWIQSNK